MTRRCPKCGEPVPSNCLTCPKCYAKIPAEPVKTESTRQESSGTGQSARDPKIALLLTIIPAIFGLLGLGMIYMNSKRTEGYLILAVGLVLFLCGNALLFMPTDFIVAIFKTILGVGLLFLYILLFLFTLLGSVLRVNVVRAGQR